MGNIQGLGFRVSVTAGKPVSLDPPRNEQVSKLLGDGNLQRIFHMGPPNSLCLHSCLHRLNTADHQLTTQTLGKTKRCFFGARQ